MQYRYALAGLALLLACSAALARRAAAVRFQVDNADGVEGTIVVAFSNDARGKFGLPKYEAARFAVAGQDLEFEIRFP